MAGEALVLFAHGARDARWAAPFARLKAELQALMPGARIELAFLELMQPSLPECAAALYGAGVRSVRVVPVFFGMGGHLREDLPKIVEDIRARHAGLALTVEPPIGEQAEVIGAIARSIAGRRAGM